eukprot:TRINITY_DN2284_c1_g1_i2.p1 TRINITY_DN2284_c1_g1~~TRINITY_DN2284_c1_g1_i2.p1  ORF type:complete len:629 (-),score=173.96 TRINITY_DN2284_c1_g1_i2:156-2042(-)
MKQHEVRWSGSDTCKLRDYKVRVNQQVKREQPLLLLEYTSSTETGSRLVVETLKSDVEGRVFSLPGKRGQKFEVGDILMIISTCTHPFQFEGICVQCNANVTQFQNAIASPMIVSKSKGIKLSHEAAAEIQKAHEEKLLKERKLCLILDLDLTVLHAVRADHLYNFDPEKYKAKIYSLEGIEYYTYYVKFRPYVEQFLEEIKDLYEIHVYTMSTRQYATSVVGIMDKMIEDGKRAMFGNSRTGFRLLTRDENSSSVKDLRTIFPHGDDIAVILDDREDVWESSLNNLIQIHPYTFSYFNHAGDIHDPKLPPPVHRPQYSTPSQKPRLSLNTDRKKKNKEQESTSSTSTSTTNQDSYIQQQAQLQQQQHQDSNIQQQSTQMIHRLVLLRHGESVWNKENRFTGWTDVDLSEQGVKEAHRAGQSLKKEGFTFDLAYTSVLKRAIRTLWISLDELDLMWIPVKRNWRLNERHYGALQGLNKSETAAKHGEAQVQIWRRAYDVPPPALESDDPRHPSKDKRYAELKPEQLPKTECLKDTVERFLPLWHDEIAPSIKSGKNVLIAAHGNSLRALVKYLDNMTEEAVLALDIPTGIPLVYELDENLKPIKHYYLADEETVKAAQQAVANQGKAK